MRIIDIYQMEQEYVVGDVKNLHTLKGKLEKDAVLLKEIEEDFNQNPSQFKNEYINAKTNHLKNRYMYYWAFLKWYFDQALFTEHSSFPDFQKEQMKKQGWMFPHAFINTKITTSGGVNVTTEELYMRNFNRLFDELFGFNIGEKNSRIDRYYKQAIFNYKNKCYFSCAVSLFPIIESYHQYMNNFNNNEFYKIKNHLESITEKVEAVKQIYVTRITYYINLVKQFNDLAENHYFNKSLDRQNEPEIINRNRIMHGLFSREISQKDCLQLLCVVSNMVVIKKMSDANERMNEIEKEVAKLQESIAKPKD